MSEFSKQLADALVRAMDHTTLAEGYHMSPADHVRRLAPKVAIAIREAMYGATWCAVTHGHAPEEESGNRAALKSLRGGA